MQYIRTGDGRIRLTTKREPLKEHEEIIYESTKEFDTNTVSIKNRADTKIFSGKIEVTEGAGTLPTSPHDLKLLEDKTKTQWNEPFHKTEPITERRCLYCNREMINPRSNKKYCGKSCRDKFLMRKKRAVEREARNFKPGFGTKGQFNYQLEDRRQGFIPALFTETNEKFENFVNEYYEKEEDRRVILEQWRGFKK